MRSSPCLDCCSRCEGCHSICDLYQEFRETKERIQDEVLADLEYTRYLSDAVQRMKGVRRS